MLTSAAKKGDTEIPFRLAQLMAFSYRDVDENDKGDLTSVIKQYSSSLALSNLHSCALLSPPVSECP